LVFVAHSLGGIVVKKALILAHEQEDQYGSLLQQIAGVVFMGTPHRGANIADSMSYLASGLHLAQFGAGTNRELLACLKKDSTVLAEITQRFAACCQDMKIVSFYETRRYSGKLVSEHEFAIILY
jgi:predicted alpha/beta hydrolase family esterase